MYTIEFPSTSDEVWKKIEKLVSTKEIVSSWTMMAEELGYSDKKQRKAFHARRHRKPSDWNLIISILKVLHCELYFLVPETRKDIDAMKKIPESIKYRDIGLAWEKLKPADKELARKILERLDK